jgi:hypothetical protein
MRNIKHQRKATGRSKSPRKMICNRPGTIFNHYSSFIVIQSNFISVENFLCDEESTMEYKSSQGKYYLMNQVFWNAMI